MREYRQGDNTMASKVKPLTFLYKNWKGETRQRIIEPVKIWFGSTEYHPEPQWLLKAYDVEKREHRDFALNDVVHWGDNH